MGVSTRFSCSFALCNMFLIFTLHFPVTFSFLTESILTPIFKLSSFQNNFKVAVAGASGGIGQPLSLLLKINPLVSELSLYDIVHTPGVAADLSHIETAAKVKA